MRQVFERFLGVRNLSFYFPYALAILPEQFDSNDFIAAFAFQQQRAYIRALSIVEWETPPFQTVNENLIQWLAESELVEQVGTRESENLFKQVCVVAVWKKVGR